MRVRVRLNFFFLTEQDLEHLYPHRRKSRPCRKKGRFTKFLAIHSLFPKRTGKTDCCEETDKTRVTSNKSEVSERFYSISAFQNGWSPPAKGYAEGRGLHVQKRLKRCIF